ncbi:beta-propeller fold lactonase family protein [Buchnera aphidicola]|uniref:beta-propeller fold lactonase family protein n=1 Tax=Buchnera aphidicola TaxID=9 RepID=UPI0031B82492
MNKIVYISMPNKNVIQVLKINENMFFEKIQNFKVSGNIQPINIFKEKKLLYVGLRYENKILTLKILKDGTLKKNSEINIKYPTNHINIDFKNKILFSSSFHGDCLELYKINKYGIPYKKYYTIHNIRGCHFSLLNNYYNLLFFTALKEDKIYYFNMSNLKKIQKNFVNFFKLGKKFGPRHCTIHSNKKILYIINELNSTISTVKIYKNMEILQNISLLPNTEKKYWASEIQITPCSKYLFASDRHKNIITSFKVKKNYTLKLLKFYNTEIQPRTFKIDSSGKYLIVAGEISNNISLYEIDKKNGNLKCLIKNFFVGGNPVCAIFFDI